MTKSMKITAILAVSSAAYAVSAYAFQTNTDVSHSPYKDVRDGKTVPASQGNGFVGRLADGRPVQVIQVSRRMPSGEIIAWKPDGTPIPESDRVKYFYRNSLDALNTHVRYVFVKFPPRSGGSGEISVGIGSGTHDAQSPSTLEFAGGGLIGNEGDQNIMVGFIGIPKEDGSNIPAGFSIADGPYEDHGAIKAGHPMLRNVRVSEVASPEKEDTPAIGWAKGFDSRLTVVDFEVLCPDGTMGDLVILPVMADGSKSNPILSHGNYGGYSEVDESRGGPKLKSNQKTYLRSRRYFAFPISKVKEFHLLTRTSLNCELRGVAANPKGP